MPDAASDASSAVSLTFGSLEGNGQAIMWPFSSLQEGGQIRRRPGGIRAANAGIDVVMYDIFKNLQ